MAVLAIGLAGAGLGSAIGIGASFGFIIGSVLGNLLFPPAGIVNEGPRLGDTSISGSSYGVPIALLFGTVRVGGNVIWAKPLEEVEERRKVGGKGGLLGPKQTQVTYSYFANFAMQFGVGPAEDVLRIWADSKLIFDKTSTDLVRKDGLNFRFYPGTETQLPDSLIEEDKGVGSVSAHRGTCYIVFEDLKVDDFGRRLPNITAEIAFNTTTSTSAIAGTNTGSAFDVGILAADFKRRRAYLVDHAAAPDELRVYNLDTLNEFRQVTATEMGLESIAQIDGIIAGRFTGNIYHAGRRIGEVGSSNSLPILKQSPDTYALIGTFGSAGSSTSNGTARFGASRLLCEGNVLNALGGSRNFLAQVAQGDDLGLIDADTMSYIWHTANTIEPSGLNTVSGQSVVDTVFWYALHAGGNSNLLIQKLTVNGFAKYDPLYGGTEGVTYALADTILPSTWLTDGSGSPAGPAIDQDDGGLIFIMDVSGANSHVFKWIEGQGVVWSTLVVGTQKPIRVDAWAVNSIITKGRMGYIDSTESAALIDTTDGSIIIEGLDVGTSTGINNPQGAQFWEADNESILSQNTGTIGGNTGSVARLFLDRAASQAVTEASIVQRISEIAGYDPVTDLDLTELTETRLGYAIARPISCREAIEPLATTGFFDTVESDFKVKFLKRGRDPVAAIVEADLVELDQNGEILQETLLQEVELPEEVNVIYIDQGTDYQQATASAKRIRQPAGAIRSREKAELQLAMVLTPTQGDQIAERLLFTTWNESISHQWALSQEFLPLDPTDVVTITLDSGTVVRSRISQIATAVGLQLTFDGLKEAKETFLSNSVQDGPLGVPQKLPPSPKDVRVFQLNVPLLRDVDDATQAASRSYFAMSGFQIGTRGGNLLQSLDSGASFQQISRALGAASYGVITNALPDPVLPYQVDTTTVLSVAMQVGDLASVTQSQFITGVNVALVGNFTTNVWELIAFKNATEIVEGIYDVDTLVRGKRGTDVFVGDHVAGEFFIPVDTDSVFAYLLTLAQLNISIPYKATSFGQIEEDVTAESFTGLGRDLKPYAPAHLAAVEDGGNNIDFSWVRRTRISGDLLNNTTSTSIPLSEVSELYEVDVKDGPGGAVVRQFGLSGTLAVETVQYDNADIITDFGFVPATITFSVYQISGAVGRGFEREATITL